MRRIESVYLSELVWFYMNIVIINVFIWLIFSVIRASSIIEIPITRQQPCKIKLLTDQKNQWLREKNKPRVHEFSNKAPTSSRLIELIKHARIYTNKHKYELIRSVNWIIIPGAVDDFHRARDTHVGFF